MATLQNLLCYLVAIYIGFCITLYFAQRSLIYHPTHGEGLIASAVTELEVDGLSIKVSAREHPGPNALIYFGGNAEAVAQSLPDYSQAFPNHAIYMLHYRGYDGSAGMPSEAALHTDAKALFDKVKTQHPNVTLIGRSLGSGVAVRLAATTDVHGLVLITPYDSILNIARTQFPWLPVGLLLKDRFESARFAPLVKARTIILAAQDDQIIPKESTQALLEAFRPDIAKISWIPEVDHNSISDVRNYFELMSIEQGRS
ncbi:alpha/beta hydrolase [Chitinimonas sp. PSY-7]|uniref:alpha/beta fold hydrolase n=1 Tax=Chitinimonas sp. PSY-7 TaxID=3459088 RepID=UPI00403FC990